ncbi:GntR family transcriptional regulator [Georgenia alba]|uniref:GntR family transcriptional regulator n=1 Tax=Georgenia alba TaxID=2233858 RepID=A0ABW2Q3W1_9MICO
MYEELLSRIISSDLEPEDRITIDAVSREIGVSQTPVREALHKLAAEGVVVHHHLSGYRVAPKLSKEQFEHLVEFRLALEPVAARNAAERMSKEMFGELEHLNSEMATVLTTAESDHGYAAFSRFDAQFHDAIARGGGNPYIRESLLRLHLHTHLFRLANYQQITTRAVDEHAEVLAALRARDPGEAALSMRQHIHLSAGRFRTSFE